MFSNCINKSCIEFRVLLQSENWFNDKLFFSEIVVF